MSMYIPTRREVAPRKTLSPANLARMGIPKLFFEAEIDDYVGDSNKKKLFTNYINNIHDMFDDGVNLTLYGNNGSGKTFVTSIILKNAYRHYYSAKRINFTHFMSLTFSADKSDEDKEYIKQAYESEFLVIDELGKENDTKSSSNIALLEQLMKYREEKALPTIICTNLSLEGIKELYRDTIYSLVSQSVKMEMDDFDMRKDFFGKRKGIVKLFGGVEDE